MPYENRFEHQRYTENAPVANWELLKTPLKVPPDSPQYQLAMERVGEAYREAGIKAMFLVHGTFAGDDASGLFRDVSRIVPGLSVRLRRAQKRLIDQVAGDAGNYLLAYSRELHRRLQLPVDIFHWSSENQHIARAEAALRLLLEISDLRLRHDDRVLLWGHSHAGNVFALLSNLLAADRRTRTKLFAAWRSCAVFFPWKQAELWLDRPREERILPQLDFVTFGTPIRYGWDTDGYAKLLHFVHHRPQAELPPYRTALPSSLEDVMTAAAGDYIQHLGIAGTNLAPSFWAWRTWLADVRLGRLLQGGVRRRDLLANLRAGMRVPEEGETLLVDYGPVDGHIGQHLAGHAVYTRRRWMLFHLKEIARRLYGAE